MALIQNDVVSMDWEATHFFETKKGFYAAFHVYETENGDVPVCFQDQVAYILLDEDRDYAPADPEKLTQLITQMYKEGEIPEDMYPDTYLELGRVMVDGEGADLAMSKGLTAEDIKDINDRLNDLSGYWAIVEEPMTT